MTFETLAPMIGLAAVVIWGINLYIMLHVHKLDTDGIPPYPDDDGIDMPPLSLICSDEESTV
jgi:hypothetical protein